MKIEDTESFVILKIRKLSCKTALHINVLVEALF